jgi:hypothetical protein
MSTTLSRIVVNRLASVVVPWFIEKETSSTPLREPGNFHCFDTATAYAANDGLQLQGIRVVELTYSPVLYGCVTCVIVRDRRRFRICENEVSWEVRDCRTEEVTE